MSETPSTPDTETTVPETSAGQETDVDQTTPVDGGAPDSVAPASTEPAADVAEETPAAAAPEAAPAEAASEVAAPEAPEAVEEAPAVEDEPVEVPAEAEPTLGNEPVTAAGIVSTPGAVMESSKDAQARTPEPGDAVPAQAPSAPAPEADAADETAAPAAEAPAEEPRLVAGPTPVEGGPEKPADTPEAEAAAEVAEAPKAEVSAPVPSPAAIAPSKPAAAAPAPVKAPETPLDPKDVAEAGRFGRVAEDGTVYVTEEAGERAVGQFPDASADEALQFYVRRYLDLVAQVRLFETRIPNLSGRDLDQTLASLKEQTAEPQAVGDLDGLRQRVKLAEERAQVRRGEIAAEREAARATALARREEIVSAAEAIAERDPARTQWKNSGEDLHALLDQWKDAQRQGPRIDKPTEDALWKRFSKARTLFDRNRRAFFSERDAEYSAAKAAKEDLIARAEALSSSTDWGPTAGAYRDLMNEWRAAGRARRKDDDALWERFRAAQQTFFDARDAVNREIDTEYAANLEVKEAILVEAEALLPIKDPKDARNKLRLLQDRWDEAGRVPRSDLARVEARMRAVEKAVRDVEDAEWRRSNPETKARVSSATSQLEAAIASLEKDLAAAEAKGDKKKIAAATEALAARRAWLEQIQASE